MWGNKCSPFTCALALFRKFTVWGKCSGGHWQNSGLRCTQTMFRSVLWLPHRIYCVKKRKKAIPKRWCDAEPTNTRRMAETVWYGTVNWTDENSGGAISKETGKMDSVYISVTRWRHGKFDCFCSVVCVFCCCFSLPVFVQGLFQSWTVIKNKVLEFEITSITYAADL